MAKFAVGEIALALMASNEWVECEILATPEDRARLIDGHELPARRYLIHVPGLNSGVGNGAFAASEEYLRKRPQRGIPLEVLRLFEQPISEDATA